MAFDLQAARLLLLELGDSIRDKLIRARATSSAQSLTAISRESAADTIYEIDRVTEEVIETWFAKHWPREAPIELVMEGIDDPVTIPHGLPVEETMYKCILDPIDGTRGIMYDKRSAWFLAGLAPQKGVGTQLSDIEAAVMVELPTSKQWRADRISAVRGQGAKADSINVLTGEKLPLTLQPSTASDPWHGFAYTMGEPRFSR
jgi:fructose-1,6-bisphosphatase/inositol monophosphatase family enzyme